MHDCPVCGQACYCNGDIDDCPSGDESAELICRHCDEYDEDEDFDNDCDGDERANRAGCIRCGGFVPAGTGVVCPACFDGDGGPMFTNESLADFTDFVEVNFTMTDETVPTLSTFDGWEELRRDAIQLIAPLHAILNAMHSSVIRGRMAVENGEPQKAAEAAGKAEGLWMAVRIVAKELLRGTGLD
jgi:hypothetical protein